MKAPTPIDLSPEAVAQLKLKIQASNVEVQTQLLLIGLIDFCLWLQFKLTESKISINRLKNLFGLTIKKKNYDNPPNAGAIDNVASSSLPANENNASNDISISSKKKPKGMVETQLRITLVPSKRKYHIQPIKLVIYAQLNAVVNYI